MFYIQIYHKVATFLHMVLNVIVIALRHIHRALFTKGAKVSLFYTEIYLIELEKYYQN